MGLFALLPVLVFLLASLGGADPAPALRDEVHAVATLPWSGIGLVNATIIGLALVVTLRRARHR